jgi:N-acetylglucosamine kinase-like BadF-type ATPase
MTQFFLGVDIGSSRSHAVLIDELGSLLGRGMGGPGNHEVVGYSGLRDTLQDVTAKVFEDAGVSRERIVGAAFGISGYDWPSERKPTLDAIHTLQLPVRAELVNDTLLGLIAGAEEGWGVAVVAGSGENCWGMDASGRVGRMTGCGQPMGEYGGASSLISKAIQAVAEEWTQRGPPTSLTQTFQELTGVPDFASLLEGLALDHFRIGEHAAALVFRAGEEGDAVARDIIRWAGVQLGNLVNGVIRQLEFQDQAFDVVETGGLFQGGALLTGPLHDEVHKLAPKARFVPLRVPPVAGAALLASQRAEADRRAIRRALLSRETWF